MKLFNINVATEANDYMTDTDDQVWIKGDNGQLILLEDSTDESNKE